MSTSDGWICPECEAGKHGNCNGDTWDFDADEKVPCQCPAEVHAGVVSDGHTSAPDTEAQRELFAWGKRLNGAWSCCGTCWGGVLAEHDRALRTAHDAVLAQLAEVRALADQHEEYCCSKGCAGPGICMSGPTVAGPDGTQIRLTEWPCDESCNCSSAPYLAVLAKAEGEPDA